MSEAGNRLEEVWDAATHALGLVVSIAGASALIVGAALGGDPWLIS